MILRLNRGCCPHTGGGGRERGGKKVSLSLRYREPQVFLFLFISRRGKGKEGGERKKKKQPHFDSRSLKSDSGRFPGPQDGKKRGGHEGTVSSNPVGAGRAQAGHTPQKRKKKGKKKQLSHSHLHRKLNDERTRKKKEKADSIHTAQAIFTGLARHPQVSLNIVGTPRQQRGGQGKKGKRKKSRFARTTGRTSPHRVTP